MKPEYFNRNPFNGVPVTRVVDGKKETTYESTYESPLAGGKTTLASGSTTKIDFPKPKDKEKQETIVNNPDQISMGLKPATTANKVAQPYAPVVNGNYNNALDLEVPKILTSDIVPFEKEENYGISHNQQLNPITRFDNFFKNEAEKKRTDFSSNLTPVGRCDWYKMHKDIKGEFYDKTFDPEDLKNLMGFEKNTSKYDENLIKYLKDNFNWRRFSYMFPDCRVMGTTIDPRSLFSGFIGDCYFMSALSSLSEHPGRTKRLFNQQKRSPKGAYSVNLCINGQFREFILDDMFPVKRNQIVFGYSEEKDIWAMLLEKAYAKAYGGYMNIGAGGLAENTLFDLTGMPCETITWEEEEIQNRLFDILNTANSGKFTMVARSKSKGVVKNPKGIIGDYDYTLMGVHKLAIGDKLVKLRNPWSKAAWKGDFNEKSYHWTETLITYLDVSEEDDGIFFLPIKDFIEQFECVTLCHFNENMQRSCLFDLNSQNQIAMYQFRIDNPGSHYFGLSQNDKRMFESADHTYANLSIVVARVSDREVVYVGGKGQAQRDIWFKTDCQPGQYLAFVTTNWDNDKSKDFSFWINGQANIEIERVVQPENTAKIPSLLAQCYTNQVYYYYLIFYNFFQVLSSKVALKEINMTKPWNQVKMVNQVTDDGYVICYVENSTGQALNFSSDFTGSKNLRVGKFFFF